MSNQWEALSRPPGVSPPDKFSASLVKFLTLIHHEPIEAKIRSSNLPLCGRSYSFSQTLPEEEISETSDFLLDLHSNMGKVSHSIVQKWLGKSGILLGDWMCRKCHKIKKWHLGTPVCKRCGKPMVYKELSYVHPSISITGHPDGILLIEGEHVGFELKNKSQQVVDDLDKPIDTHVFYQTSCYAALLKLIYGIKLKEYVIFYMSRGLPFSYKVGCSPRKGAPIEVIHNRGSNRGKFLLKIFRFAVDTKAVEKEFKHIEVILKAQKKAGNKLLSREKWGLCKEFSESGFCPHRYICFNRK